jgi:hypothetical protein
VRFDRQPQFKDDLGLENTQEEDSEEEGEMME